MAVLRWLVIKFILFFYAWMFSSVAYSDNVLRSIHENNKGVASLEHEDAVAAEQSFIKALAQNPFNITVHLNLGITFEMQKHFDKALKENESVLRYTRIPEDLKFTAHFNAANAASQAKKVDVAVQHYQAALDISPESMETKTNIELLFKSGAGKGKGSQGGGKGKEPSESDQGQGEQPQEQPNQDKNESKKEKPKFDSQNLTKEDVRKILEELKSQEQKIRAMEYGTKGKEAAPEKDW